MGLDESDQDVIRFLWVDDIERDKLRGKGAHLVHYRFSRMFFGAKPAPYLLGMVLQTILKGSNPAFVIGRRDFYVDNLVSSVDSCSEATMVQRVLTKALGEAGMNLRDWCSNNASFESTLPPDSVSSQGNEISILGLTWNKESDILSFSFEIASTPQIATIKAALSLLASVYDPLGLIAPCLVDLKTYIQDCWKQKVSVSQNLPEDFEKRFRYLATERNAIKNIAVPRYLWSSQAPHAVYEYHVFCDASKRALGSAHYLVQHSSSHFSEAQLIFGKSRVAPSPGRSVPQLELMALLVGVRSATMVQPQLSLHLNKTVFWSDKTSVLQWLNSDKIQPPFIENRLKEIRKFPQLNVRHVSSEDNPADIASRGKTAAQLATAKLWWSGSTWLP